MILVDTSVWIDHLRRAEPHLQKLLKAGRVLMHDMVLGEISCGGVANRKAVSERLNGLPMIGECSHAQVLSLIERKGLFGRGTSLVDAHVLCSVLNNNGTALWTRDRRSKQIADDLGIVYAANP